MATHPQTAIVSLDDFIAALEASEAGLEFVDGQIVALAGTSLEHALITQRIAQALGAQLRGRSCEVVSQGTLVTPRVGDNAYLPDVVVFCGGPQRERVRGSDLLLNPTLIVEVLSPSTAGYDHVTKGDSYRRISSLQDYLLVSQDRPRIQQFTRHGEGFWLFKETTGLDAVVRLESLDVSLVLTEIYEGVLAADGLSA
jgi:Uma2 family endonuclease